MLSMCSWLCYEKWGYDPETYPIQPWTYPKGIECIDETPNYTQELIQRGYTDEDIQKILDLNFIRVCQQV